MKNIRYLDIIIKTKITSTFDSKNASGYGIINIFRLKLNGELESRCILINVKLCVHQKQFPTECKKSNLILAKT